MLDTVRKGKRSIYANLLKQINAKMGQDLYQISMPKDLAGTMQIGVDVCHEGRQSIVGLTATYSEHMTQHFSRTYRQALGKELIGNQMSKDEQETFITQGRS